MNRVWSWLVLAVMAIAGMHAHGEDKGALTARLQKAAAESSIDDPALKPWHLKLTFQLLDKKGASSEEGSIEEWWSGGSDKRIYISPSYNATEIRRDKKTYRTKDKTPAPYLLELLRDEVVHPLADNAEVRDAVPDLRVESFGKVKLDCIMLNHPIKNVVDPPLGLFPTYCLDQETSRIRVSFRYGAENVMRNSIGTFQGRDIPIDTIVSVDGVTAAKAHIAELSGATPEDHFFDPDNSLQEQRIGVVRVSPGVADGVKIGGAVPIYPAADKQTHTSGAVHLHAVIGTDGRVHRLTVVDAPSLTLAISALAAVRTWVYKPYLLNGVLCSIETSITVNYNFG